jgi:hypothetical protein
MQKIVYLVAAVVIITVVVSVFAGIYALSRPGTTFQAWMQGEVDALYNALNALSLGQ